MKLLDFKKGQSPINIFIPIISLLFFGISLLIISLLAYTSAQQILITFPTVTELPTILNDILNIYKIYDYTTLTLSIIFIISIGYTSYRIRAKPSYYIVTFLTASFYGFIAYVLSYIYSQFASNSVFSVILYLFPLTTLVLTNLHWLALILIIIAAITLYTNNSSQEIPLR